MQTRFELLVNPVRLQILHAFGAGDLRLTHAELVARLEGLAPEIMEKHLGILMESGMIEATGEGAERMYRVPQGATRITPTDVLSATPADHLRYFTTFVAGLIEMFSRYIKRPNADIVEAGVNYRQVTLHLSRDELHRLEDEMDEMFRRYFKNSPGGGRKPMVINRIILPEVLPDE